MNIDWKRIPPVLHHISFEVVAGNSPQTPDCLILTPALQKVLQESSALSNSTQLNDAAPERIRQLIGQYPQAPMFKNHLFVFYFRKGSLAEAQQIAAACAEAHPGYFYNGIMQSMLWMYSEADREKIPALLHEWNIVDYAGRAKFEEHEVRAYYLTATDYHLRTLQVDAADQFLYFIETYHHSGHANIALLRREVEAARKLLAKRKERYRVKKGK